MNVRLPICTALALVALLLGAGCGGGDGTPFSLETDESLYQQAKGLQRQGRNPEALTSYLKLIEKRGQQNSPEAHFEAGLIYLHDIKNPIEAIHHFNRHLELQQLSVPQQTRVRSLIESAKREFAKTIPGRFNDEQSARSGGGDSVERLQREIEDLKMENQRLRGGGPAPFLRTTRGPIEQVEVVAPPVSLGGEEMGVRIASPPPNLALPAAPRAVQTGPTVGGRPTPTRPPGASLAPVAGRRYKIAPGDNLFQIARKHGVTVEAIAMVNRDVLPSGVNSPLRPGTELKIP